MKYLIAGLGNIGAEYEGTRHNIGFDVLNHLAEKHSATFELSRQAHFSKFKTRGRTFCLIKPTTYMNLSGKAIRYWIDAEKIPVENVLVVVDDLNLPFGKIRMRGKGSSGGHNGIEDIIRTLGTSGFARLRFGIGDEFNKGRQVNFVLGRWSDNEEKELDERIKIAGDACVAFGTIGLGRAMTQFNAK